MRENTRIVIAGAGLGGLTAALALLQKGFAVEILEKAPQLGEVGAGVQNSPNAVRVLYALGLGKELEKNWFVPEAREMRLWNTGSGPRRPMSAAETIERYGSPVIHLHRADLHRSLVEAVMRERRASIRLGANCVGFEQDASGASVVLESGERVRGAMLVGADGIHSTIRKQLFGPSKAKFTKQIAWRGLIPVERLPEPMRKRNGQTWVGPSAHVTLYPIRRGELVNFVGQVDDDKWQVESWIEPGDKADFARDFLGWHEEIQTMIRCIDTPYKWGLFLHDPLPSWSVGRVTLLGDACHSMLPYLGQGANMAIEDGYVLARCVAAFEDDMPKALRCYEAVRVPRTTKIVEESAANGRRFRTPAKIDPSQAEDYITKSWEGQTELRHWIYSFDATSVPIAQAVHA